MQSYIARRLGQTLIVLIVISVIIFGALRLLPGDPAAVFVGREGSKAAIEAIRRDLGLDKPIYVQYFLWLKEVLRGNFGISWFTKHSAMELLRAKLPATLMLTFGAVFIGLIIALPLGIISGIKPHSWIDNFATTFSLFGVAMPSFWVGMMLMLLFAVRFRILPAAGYVNPSENLGQSLLHLILPALTLGIQLAASQARFLRSGLLDVMGTDYIRTARGKGLQEWRVITSHALKNALLTVVTVFAIDFGGLLGGALVTETVFFWPGIGTLLVQSIGNRDYGVVQAVVLFVALVYITVNLLADLAYAYLDPRIRFDKR
jgi:peptide/nickel transport system permease protein